MLIFEAIGIIVASALCGVLYRMGGSGNFPRQVRICGCALIIVGARYIVGTHSPWWTDLIVYGFTAASLSTYWDCLFGFDNFWFHGFMLGLSAWAYTAWGNYTVTILLVRSLVLALLMGLWWMTCRWLKRGAVWDEVGRGVMIPLTYLLVLLQ